MGAWMYIWRPMGDDDDDESMNDGKSNGCVRMNLNASF